MRNMNPSCALQIVCIDQSTLRFNLIIRFPDTNYSMLRIDLRLVGPTFKSHCALGCAHPVIFLNKNYAGIMNFHRRPLSPSLSWSPVIANHAFHECYVIWNVLCFRFTIRTWTCHAQHEYQRTRGRLWPFINYFNTDSEDCTTNRLCKMRTKKLTMQTTLSTHSNWSLQMQRSRRAIREPNRTHRKNSWQRIKRSPSLPGSIYCSINPGFTPTTFADQSLCSTSTTVNDTRLTTTWH